MKLRRLAVLLLLGVGCAEPRQRNGCGSDNDCETSEACVARRCLSRGVAGAGYFVSVEPPQDGATCRASPTEFAGVSFGVAPTALALAPGTLLSGTIAKGNLAANLPDGAGFRVAIDLTSLIPNQPPHVYTAYANGATPPAFTILVPSAAVNTAMAVVRVIPPENVTRLIPPRPVSATLTSPLELALPRSQDVVAMTGTLLTALQTPAAGMEARATASGVSGGPVISNEGVSDAMGSFTVSVLANEAGRDPPVVDLALFPANANLGQPSLHLSGVPVKSDSLQRVTLPPYPAAEAIRVAALGPDESGQLIPVEGAVMRFETRISGFTPLPYGGVVTHLAVSESDASGAVELRLIPGVGSEARDYSVRVDTPPESAFASRCVPAYSVVASGGPGPRIGAPIILTRKAKLSGQLLLSDDSSPGVVSITATGIGSDGCPNLLGRATGQTVSNRAGEFELYLPVGLHRIDYVPAAGGQAPSTFELVEVGGDRLRRFVFPEGRVGEGRVEAPMNCSAAGLPVRVFGMDARETVPREIARALTDAEGRFRVVLPVR